MMMEDPMEALNGALPSMDDDLFGDEVLPLAPRAPSKQLQKRVDEARSRGCCRYDHISPPQPPPYCKPMHLQVSRLTRSQHACVF